MQDRGLKKKKCSTMDAEAMSVVSSAKISGSDSRSAIISLMCMMKRSGPNLEPCGTPASTGSSEDVYPSTTVFADLPLRYDSSRLWLLPLMLRLFNFSSKALCQTASKAALMSRKPA